MNPLILGGMIGAALLSLNKTSPVDYSPGVDMSGNIDAFLAVIREGESSDNYRAIVGGGTFSDYSRHPGLNADGSINKSFLPGKPSHAAGAYQFQPGTWAMCARKLGLSSFDPDSQDKAAVYLLQYRGAYDAIRDGKIGVACDLLKPEWEMFTLPRWSSDRVANLFEENGGVLV